MDKKVLLIRILMIAAGIALLVLGVAGIVDAFWSGMGGALIGISAMHLIQTSRYQKNEAYRENVDTARNDERNQFLKTKAWSWAGFWFMMIAAVSTIALKIAGHEDLMMMASGSVCLLLALYWISYFLLRRKY